jgi:hypothetical protein
MLPDEATPRSGRKPNAVTLLGPYQHVHPRRRDQSDDLKFMYLPIMTNSPPGRLTIGDCEPGLARRTWWALEPLHGMIYFSPEAAARYEALGLEGRAGYFASRAAAMGTVPAEVVIATFYNFNPEVVRSAIAAAWRAAPPERVLEARLAAADATLRQVLGPLVDSREIVRAAELARRAAEAVGDDVAGRPLYAAHAALPWPDEPHLVLWHAQTLLREYRGDGHVAALLTAGLSGIEALVTHAATGAIPAESLRTTRAWSAHSWNEAIEGLRRKDWLTAAPEPTLTEAGRLARERVEETTDKLGLLPYAALGAEGCRELQDIARPLTDPLIATLMPWARRVR